MEMLENGQEIPLHTMQGWAQRGPYRIKKGEHGFETKLWRKKKKKARLAAEQAMWDDWDEEENAEKQAASAASDAAQPVGASGTDAEGTNE